MCTCSAAAAPELVLERKRARSVDPARTKSVTVTIDRLRVDYVFFTTFSGLARVLSAAAGQGLVSFPKAEVMDFVRLKSALTAKTSETKRPEKARYVLEYGVQACTANKHLELQKVLYNFLNGTGFEQKVMYRNEKKEFAGTA